MMETKKLRFVITGNIGCGKSTVCKMLAEKGITIIDADEISREVYKTQEDEILKVFGTTNRKEVANIVFKDKEEMKKLIDILECYIHNEIDKQVAECEKNGKVYIVDIPLFYETNHYHADNVIVVATMNDELRIQRISARNPNWTLEDIQDRINCQMATTSKINRAKYAIYNDGTKAELHERVDKLFKILFSKEN